MTNAVRRKALYIWRTISFSEHIDSYVYRGRLLSPTPISLYNIQSWSNIAPHQGNIQFPFELSPYLPFTYRI